MNQSHYPTDSAQNPVETTIEDSDETTTHIKTDSIKLQKTLNTKDNPIENEITNPTKKMKHKLQKVDIDQLQDQRKKDNNTTTQYRTQEAYKATEV